MRTWWILGVCLVGCSSSETPTDGGTDASIDAASDVQADAPQEAGKDGGTACNTLSNVGTVIQQTYVATDGVTGDGGTIVSGTYVLTAMNIYTGADGGSGPTGTTFQDTLALEADGGTYERVVSIVNDAGSDGGPIHQNGAYTLNGSSLQIDQTCPVGTQPFTSYDSDGTKIHIYAPAAGLGSPALMSEYTKQ